MIDQRDHVGGNVYDGVEHFDTDGATSVSVWMQKYGPHIFHTNSDMVWKFVNEFCEWVPYYHRVMGEYSGKAFSLPLNRGSLTSLLNAELYYSVIHALDSEFNADSVIRLGDLANRAKQLDYPQCVAFETLAEVLREVVCRRYSELMWGLPFDKIETGMPEVINRVPFRNSFDDRYFTDKYQALPAKGYTDFVQRIIDRCGDRLEVRTSTKYEDLDSKTRGLPTFYTGPIDQFFGYKLGHLGYRTIDFRTEVRTIWGEATAGTAVATTYNILSNVKEFTGATRYTLMSKLQPLPRSQLPINKYHTAVVTELPREAGPKDVPMYPVPNLDNKRLYSEYTTLALQEVPHIRFSGRLGSYQYLDMHQAIALGLHEATRFHKLQS
jgi:UDP-galactopyranose mutase